jgi:uncharacterized protein (TIGR03437 family)
MAEWDSGENAARLGGQLKMRHAMGAIPFLMAISPLLAPADQLPAYCGGVGAKSYTPPAVTIPAVVLNHGTVITVTNATMLVNGDTSSVKALVANPGPDGISLQEAITATNNDPGTWVIQFAPALKGSTIDVNPGGQGGGLAPLTGGNVTINGDIDGDGKPAITLTNGTGTAVGFTAGFGVLSGGNTLYGLALRNFSEGVFIQRPSAANGLPPATGTTFSNITISNLAITGIQDKGIWLCPTCGGTAAQSSAPPEVTRNTWDHILITGNTITGNDSGPLQGIVLETGKVGDTLQHTTIANNTMVGAGGIGIAVGGEVGSTNDRALDTLIANNAISSSSRGIGIGLGGNSSNLGYFKYPGNPAGGDGGSGSLIDGMQIIANQIHITGTAPSGIGLTLADTPSDGFQLPVLQYAENNIARNIGILANTIEGTGILVYAGSGTVRNDAIANLSILGNTLTGVPHAGIALEGASSFGSPAPSTGNSVSNVLVQANTIQSAVLPLDPASSGFYTFEQAINSAGIGVLVGARAPGNSVNGISIANNEVNTPSIGIAVTGGAGSGTPYSGPAFPADNNVVSAAQIFCNQVDQVPTLGVTPSSGIKGINVTAGVDAANGNQVQQLYVADNLIAGILSAGSTPAYLGAGGSGNTLSTSTTPTPAISFVANAEGESPLIAPNTWIEIKGVNLAPHQDALNLRIWTSADFSNNQMPVQLDGVSVTVNGKNAYVWYVSPSQVNVLTPPDALSGPVNVALTNNGVSSPPYVAQAQALSPSFFVFDGTHVVGVHPEGGDIGPATLYPGLTTPAKPGETIELFANGFGITSTPVVSGAVTQSGTLSPTPVIKIGGIQANVRFAGLNVTPGEFQFNVDVPPNVPDGDQPVTATINGVTTQAGVLLAVQR